MEKPELAFQLKERQKQLGHVEDWMIDRMDDDGMIDAYITCSCCGEKCVDETELLRIVHEAVSADNFIELLDAPVSRFHN